MKLHGEKACKPFQLLCDRSLKTCKKEYQVSIFFSSLKIFWNICVWIAVEKLFSKSASYNVTQKEKNQPCWNSVKLDIQLFGIPCVILLSLRSPTPEILQKTHVSKLDHFSEKHPRSEINWHCSHQENSFLIPSSLCINKVIHH